MRRRPPLALFSVTLCAASCVGQAVEVGTQSLLQGPDGGALIPDAGSPDGGSIDAGATGPWLMTSGSKITRQDGTLWVGRGVNLPDTRSCDACTFAAPDVAEVERRIDEAVDVWHASFLRLDLESYATSGGRTQWAPPTQDSSYLSDLQTIVQHIGTKPGVYVELSLWVDPTFSAVGWPTQQTLPVWQLLADTFRDVPYVLYGLSNEPQSNFDGSQDSACWTAMNTTAQAIRDTENAKGSPHHIIVAQGTRAWARVLDYYLTHRLTAGGGDNFAYETHVYDPASTFAARFETPSATLPVIIGEFGPDATAGMTLSDCSTLMASAEAHHVPYLAWTFHMRCPPNLLVDNSSGGCGVGMALQPTSWGQLMQNQLALPLPP